MNPPPCPRLDEILLAAGCPLPAELERHAAACRECADARLVDGLLRAAAQQLAPPALPDAAAVRWRARLRARADRAERAVRPIALLDKLGYAAAAAVLGALTLGQGTPAAAWPRALLRALGEAAAAAPGAAPRAPAATTAAAAMTPAGLAVAAVLLVAPPLLWGLYRSWADE